MGWGLTSKQKVTLIILILGAFVTVLNQTVVTPALPPIMAEMGIDAATAQWLTTGFTLVNAIMMPITAFLIDRFTTRSLLSFLWPSLHWAACCAALHQTSPSCLQAV